jgi:hypothetical protein
MTSFVAVSRRLNQKVHLSGNSAMRLVDLYAVHRLLGKLG